jgi:hypothetical protein
MTGRVLAGLLLALFATSSLPAQDPKLPDVATFDKLVVDSLRDVHNRGADLYNTAKEFDGAYRMYQGGLVAVRPLLGHRPAAQKLIDDGLAAAEKEANAAQKAFKLHETIEAVRKHLKEAAAAEPVKKSDEPRTKPDDMAKKDEKKPDEPKKATEEPKKKPDDPAKKPDEPKKATEEPKKKPDDPAPMPKADDPPAKPAAAAAGPTGKVLFKGRPLPAGEVSFVSLDLAKPRVFTTPIGADGTYAFKDALPPGRYAVVVTGKGVPAQYQTTTTSGLVFEVKAGANEQNIELK